MHDLILAVAHHLLFFGLIVMLVMERMLLAARPVDVRRLARIDGGYGASALLILVIGAGRVLYGGKGLAFYESNPFFWAKMAAFVLIGLASLPPTIAFVKWRRARRADPEFQPPAPEIHRIRWWTGIQLLGVIALLVFAALMARWPFG